MDLIYLLGGVAFFVLSALLARFFASLAGE